MEIAQPEWAPVRVDVVIPCYKYGRFLRQCVRSVLTQTGVDVRVLVIDDASPDNTVEVASALQSEDARLTVSHHEINRGHINAYNEGIAWATATYMLLLSADDYLLPGALERATKLMEAHPEVGFVFGNAIELSPNGNERPIETIIKATIDPAQRILRGSEFIELSGANNLVSTCTAVVRTELQKRLGEYRHELPHSGDMEMWLRFAAHAPVGFVFGYQGVYRQHNYNMSSSYYSISEGRLTYKRSGRLRDLQQRKAALDCFSEYCNDSRPPPGRNIDTLHRRLAEIALAHASAAFNESSMEESRELSKFALAAFPGIKVSSRWFRLTCKRIMGVRTWRAVRAAGAAIHAVKRSSKTSSQAPKEDTPMPLQSRPDSTSATMSMRSAKP